MSRKHYLLTIILALVGGFAGHVLYGGLAPTRTAQASVRDSIDLQWEYCAVTKAQFAGSSRGGAYWINYFKVGGGIDTETVETGVTGNALAKAIAKLGEQGWDMVGEGPLEIRPGQTGGAPSALFFKRRKN